MTAKVLFLGSLASSLRNFRGSLISAVREHGHSVYTVAPGLHEDTETLEWLSERGIESHSVRLSRAGLSPLGDLATLRQLVLSLIHI